MTQRDTLGLMILRDHIANSQPGPLRDALEAIAEIIERLEWLERETVQQSQLTTTGLLKVLKTVGDDYTDDPQSLRHRVGELEARLNGKVVRR
jgi:hypothetical protein